MRERRRYRELVGTYVEEVGKRRSRGLMSRDLGQRDSDTQFNWDKMQHETTMM